MPPTLKEWRHSGPDCSRCRNNRRRFLAWSSPDDPQLPSTMRKTTTTPSIRTPLSSHLQMAGSLQPPAVVVAAVAAVAAAVAAVAVDSELPEASQTSIR